MPGSTAMVRVLSGAPSPGKPSTGWDNAAAPSPGRRMGLALRNMMPIQPTPTAFFRQLTPTELVAQQTSRRIALKRYLSKRALRELSTLRPVGALARSGSTPAGRRLPAIVRALAAAYQSCARPRART